MRTQRLGGRLLQNLNPDHCKSDMNVDRDLINRTLITKDLTPYINAWITTGEEYFRDDNMHN